MLLTRYAPFRRSPTGIATLAAPRLACVKPAASVHPEPGSNSSWYIFLLCFESVPSESKIKKSTLSNLLVLTRIAVTCLVLVSQIFQ